MLEWCARVGHGKHEMNLEMCQCDMAWVDWFDVKLAPYGEGEGCSAAGVIQDGERFKVVFPPRVNGEKHYWWPRQPSLLAARKLLPFCEEAVLRT